MSTKQWLTIPRERRIGMRGQRGNVTDRACHGAYRHKQTTAKPVKERIGSRCGRGFDSPRLHQPRRARKPAGAFFLPKIDVIRAVWYSVDRRSL